MTFLEWLRSLFKPPPPKPKPVPKPPTPTPPPAPVPHQTLMLDELNKIRQSQKLMPFLPDAKLDQKAQEWAEWMHANGNLTHGNFKGRIGSVYPNRPIAENIAEGRDTADVTVYDWMESPGHRANILGDYVSVGCGRSGLYWCVDFLGDGP